MITPPRNCDLCKEALSNEIYSIQNYTFCVECGKALVRIDTYGGKDALSIAKLCPEANERVKQIHEEGLASSREYFKQAFRERGFKE